KRSAAEGFLLLVSDNGILADSVLMNSILDSLLLLHIVEGLLSSLLSSVLGRLLSNLLSRLLSSLLSRLFSRLLSRLLFAVLSHTHLSWDILSRLLILWVTVVYALDLLLY